MAGSNKLFCNCCVFHRGDCALGTKPVNNKRCDDYLPLCVSCPYPDLFCTTCNLQSQSGLKEDNLEVDKELGNHMYGCVWDSSTPHQAHLPIKQ